MKRETIKVKAASETTHITLPKDGRRRFVGETETTRITHTDAMVVPYTSLIRRAIADGDLVEVIDAPAKPVEAPVEAEAHTHEEG